MNDARKQALELASQWGQLTRPPMIGDIQNMAREFLKIAQENEANVERARINGLRGFELQEERDRLRTELEQAKAENAVMKGALKVYAEIKPREMFQHVSPIGLKPMDTDIGARARQALSFTAPIDAKESAE